MSPRGYDFNFDRQKTLLEKIDYCHENPVMRGLVKPPKSRRWSTYRYYKLDDSSVTNMDWDGSWPLV